MSHHKRRIALSAIAMAPPKIATKSRSLWANARPKPSPASGQERSDPVDDLAPYPNFCSNADKPRPAAGGSERRAGAGHNGVTVSSARHAERIIHKPLVAALSPLGAFGGRATREHHIRGRTQRSERLQFPTLRASLNWKQTD